MYFIKSPSNSSFLTIVKRFFCLAIFFVFANSINVAQNPIQPQPIEEENEILRIGTDLIQTDLMVFDKQGKFVEGLKPEQFEFRVNGKVQKIAFFEQVKAGNLDETYKIASINKDKLKKNSENPFSEGRVIFFFIDDLHLKFENLNRTKDGLLHFIDNEMQVNDQLAIFTASGQLGILQQLTNEKAVLHAAVKRLTFRQSDVSSVGILKMSEGQALAIEKGDRNTIDFFTRELAKQLWGPEAGKIDPRRVGVRSASRNKTDRTTNFLEDMVSRESANILEQSRLITRSTLRTLENLLKSSNSIVSRKLFFFISDGFFISPQSDIREQLKRITDAAAHSGTVIYTLDSRGVFSGVPNASEKAVYDPSASIKLIDMEAISDSQEPLQVMARETGGRALLNFNRLNGLFANVVNETSDYYILAWHPEELQRNTDFRMIEAKIKDRDDLIVRMRSGFYNQLKEISSKKSDEKPKKSKDKKSPLLNALHSLYPLRSLPVSISVGSMNIDQKLMLTTSLQIDSQTLEIDKNKKTEVDIVGVVIGEDGKIIANFEQSLTIDPTIMTEAQKRNIVYTQQVPITPGIYQVRVAVQDDKTKLIGSNYHWIEIPNSNNFSIGSLFIGEIPANDSQAVINVSRRMPNTSRFYLQTEIYNSKNPAELNLEAQIFQHDKLIKTISIPKSPSNNKSNNSTVSFITDFSLKEFISGRYILKINATESISQKSVSRQVGFIVE